MIFWRCTYKVGLIKYKVLATITVRSHGIFSFLSYFAAKAALPSLPSVTMSEQFFLQRVERWLLVVDSLEQREWGVDWTVNMHWIRCWPVIVKSGKLNFCHGCRNSFKLTLGMGRACDDKRIEILDEMRVEASADTYTCLITGTSTFLMTSTGYGCGLDGKCFDNSWNLCAWVLQSYTGRSTWTCLITGYGAGTCLMTSTGYGCGTRTSTGTVLQNRSSIVH